MTKLTAILLVLGVLVGAAAGSYIGTWLATKSLRTGTINQDNNQMAPPNQPPMQPQPVTPGQGSQLPPPSQGQTMLNQPIQNQPNQNQPPMGTGQQ